MRFWDASALVPLLVEERESPAMGELLAADRELVVWWGSPVECLSAVRRREREGSLDADAAHTAAGLLDELAEAWVEVRPTDAVRSAAGRVLAVHPLRAADALQLAAALAWAGPISGVAGRAEMVCLDERLADAAQREGMEVVPG